MEVTNRHEQIYVGKHYNVRFRVAYTGSIQFPLFWCPWRLYSFVEFSPATKNAHLFLRILFKHLASSSITESNQSNIIH